MKKNGVCSKPAEQAQFPAPSKCVKEALVNWTNVYILRKLRDFKVILNVDLIVTVS